MKRFAALVIAILMAAAILPTFAIADGEGPAVTYSGSVLDFTAKEIGSNSFFYLDVTEASGMWAGHWLVDYPEGIADVTNYSVTWSGGIQTQVGATWDDEEPWSDKPVFVCNPNYMGGSGGQPAGEPGNMYANAGMYLSSFDFMGLQMGGHMLRLTITYTRAPYFSECQQDETGWYIELPITVLESTYMIGEPGSYGYTEHTDITVENGKIYFVPEEDPFFGGTLTVNYVYEDGSEAAPTYTEVLTQGTEYSIESPFVSMYDPDIAVVEGVMPNEDVTVTVTYSRKTTYEVTYYGAVVDATDKTVGQTFFWTMGVSEHSYMWSGQWLVDYPEQYITATNYTVTWSGGITYQIGQTWDDEEAWSDKPAFVCNPAYEGQTGGNPIGEAGNLYANVGMYLTSFSYMGLQMGGDFIRLTFTLNELPPENYIPADENGSYIEMPIAVYESQYFYEYNPDSQPSAVYRPHEVINVTNGKIYVTAGEPIYGYTVTFYGLNGEVLDTQEVMQGEDAVAPEAENVVLLEDGNAYIFCGWDGDYTNITADTEIHAIYYLLGDVDFDGVITANDALLALRGSLGLMELTELQLKVGDIDFDGQTIASDALTILRFALGLLPTILG